MNYEEKYKEALEKARIYRNHLIETGDDTNEIEYIFPEIVEIENEKIRKEILSVIRQFDKNTTLCGKNYDYNKWIDWLEKQKEQKSYWNEEDEKIIETMCKEGDLKPSEMQWLKSLKPNLWKPSEEQLNAFEHFVRSIGESGYASPYDNNTKLLYSLLNDLKNL